MLHIPGNISNPKKALICYLPDCYMVPPDHPNFIGHSNFQEGRTLLSLLVKYGFSCDVLNWDADARSLIGSNYDLLIAAGNQVYYANELLQPNGKIIFYSTGSHWTTNNRGEYERIYQLQQRKKIALAPRRQVDPIREEHLAHEIWYLGNDFHRDSYQHLTMPKYRLNITTVKTPHSPKTTLQPDAQKHFLWFGSTGAVHKGLDWLLDIFATNPELHLHICGLVELEKDFYAAYQKELLSLPNIHFHGWVLPNTDKFKELCDQCAFVISPSASEGGGGATLQCMTMGLIPIVTPSNSINIGESGYLLTRNSIEALEILIHHTQTASGDELHKKMCLAKQISTENHSIEIYSNLVEKRIKALSL